MRLLLGFIGARAKPILDRIERRWSNAAACDSIAVFQREVHMASKFLLCSFKTCPWVQRAAIVLRAKNIEYEIEYIDRDKRPAWFLAVSPHSKVPVLQIDGSEALFESNAIAEYLDEVAAPRLHPEDAIERAKNRAWTDYVPSFASAISNTAYSDGEKEFTSRAATIEAPFAKLEDALAKR